MIDVFEKIIQNAEKKALEMQQVQDGDYVLDGLLHCAKCNKPKESIIKILDKIRKVPCLCPCESEAMIREEKEREIRDKIKELKRNGLADPIFGEWTFDKDDGDTPAMKYARKYVDNWETMLKNNVGLLFSGDPGVGKTFITSCIGNALILKLYPVLMTSFPRLLNELTNIKEDKNIFLNRLNKFSLLIIDDLGVERQSDFANEVVYQIIDARYKMRLPIIVSTNISIQELKNVADIRAKRIYDRILEMCIPVPVTGPNRRMDIAQKKMEEMRKFLL